MYTQRLCNGFVLFSFYRRRACMHARDFCAGRKQPFFSKRVFRIILSAAPSARGPLKNVSDRVLRVSRYFFYSENGDTTSALGVLASSVALSPLSRGTRVRDSKRVQCAFFSVSGFFVRSRKRCFSTL